MTTTERDDLEVIAATTPSMDDMPVVATRTTNRGRSALAQVLPPLVLGILILGFWYFVSYVMLDESRRFLLEPPH